SLQRKIIALSTKIRLISTRLGQSCVHSYGSALEYTHPRIASAGASAPMRLSFVRQEHDMSAQSADGSAFEFDIRVLTDERDLIAALEVFRTAMVGLPWSAPIPPEIAGKFFEVGRTLGAFADGELVGTVDSTRGSLTLPGGRTVAHAAVTHIGVLPTHTRRGIGSHLVRHQLTDARDAGEVVATLRASEATIYGRFG